MDISTLLGTLATEATKIVQNGEDEWYAASKDLEDFKDLKAKMEEKKVWWVEAIRRNGLAQEEIVREPLASAVKCLQEESKKLEELQNNGCLSFMYKASHAFQIPCVSFMFKARAFPIPLKDCMDKVVRAFERIPSRIREKQEADLMFERIADELPDVLQNTLDKEIVKLSGTEESVKKHLEDMQGNQVVTLYGGLGSGKTCLAKSLAQHYRKIAKSSPESGPSTQLFTDGAQFLPCGPKANSRSVCMKLLKNLGFNMTSESNEDGKGDLRKDSNPEGKTDLSHLKKLQRRLLELNLLIILDDVHDAKLVRDLRVLDAKKVKYLITSGRGGRGICPGATEVHMQKPTREEARQILGNYVSNLPNGEIPSSVQDVADNIISKADSLPVVLATIGRQIDHNPDDSSSWTDVYEGFYEYMSIQQNDDDDEDNEGHGDGDGRLVFGHVRYDNVIAAMLMAIKGLPSDAQNLLFCMAFCEAEALPEPLLAIFFKHITPKYSGVAFKTHLKHLKDCDFISDSLVEISMSEPPIKVKFENEWTLLGPLRYVILKEFKDEVSKILCSMMVHNNMTSGDDVLSEESALARALSVLYANPKKEDIFTAEASKTIMEVSKMLNLPLEQHERIENLKETIRHFVHILLPSQNGDKWKIRSHQLVSKVIMRFITHMDLDDQSCAQLLQEKETFTKVCGALIAMSWVWDSEEQPILTIHTRLTHERLVNMLSLKVPADLKIVALWALSSLAHHANCDSILDNDAVLQTLLEAILQPDKSDIKIHSFAIDCLGDLVGSTSARIKIASIEGLIDTLVSALDMDQPEDEPWLKSRVAYALSCIAYDEETSLKLVNSTNLVSVLTRLLEATHRKEDVLLTPMWLITCLSTLVAANKKNRALILTNNLEIMATVENFLLDDVDDDMQCGAIRILTYMDPEKYNKVQLNSIAAKLTRAQVNMELELYKEALADFESADFDDPDNDNIHKSFECFAKTMIGDYSGALESANRALEAGPTDPVSWQERGVLKELMGKYEEALEDLNCASKLGEPVDDYEVLKHRAYVNFKLGHEDQARRDAEKALLAPGHYSITDPEYKSQGLGALSVPQFLGYDLK